MKYNVLLPAGLAMPRRQIVEAVKALSHLEYKTFSVFFLQDYFNKGDYPAKSDVQLALQKEVGIPAAYFQFLHYHRNRLSFNYQSGFVDLLVLFYKIESLKPFPENFLERIECPTLFFFDSFTIPEDIAFLFNQGQKSLVTLKSFISLFGEISKEKKVTVITSSNKEHIYYEKCLVNYAKKNFTDVGIIPVESCGIENELLKILITMKKPLLIMVKSAISLMEHKMEQLAKHGISVYYSNN